MTANIFYVYIYLHRDGSPYYVGKGCNGRWKRKHGVEVPPEDRVIFLITNTTEEWAHFMEMEFIDLHGRLNDGTGILENLTDGGEGSSGVLVSKQTKQKLSELQRGKPKPPRSVEHSKKISEAKKGKPSPNKGKSMSTEQKRKISKVNSAGNVYHFINPAGEPVTINGSLNRFCKDNYLHTGAMSQVHLGIVSHYKGWTKHALKSLKAKLQFSK